MKDQQLKEIVLLQLRQAFPLASINAEKPPRKELIVEKESKESELPFPFIGRKCPAISVNRATFISIDHGMAIDEAWKQHQQCVSHASAFIKTLNDLNVCTNFQNCCY